uniref:Cytochrome P450 412a2 n=1 Tax=Leptinotarsa decemlineata TaxID=7539 RepID=V5K559_LEPDE|nr:cytochrome P450 412a2 [Leptinotarsa decemlineata]
MISSEDFSRYDVRTYLVVSLITAFAVWYIKFLWNRKYLYIYSWKVEGPLSFPFLGCGYLLLGNLINNITKQQAKSRTGIVRFWMGMNLVYLLSEPIHLQKVLSHPKALEKDYSYKYVTETIGEGLLSAPVNVWKRHRKLLAPSFNHRVLNTAVGIFTEYSVNFAKELQAVVGKKNFDLYAWTIRCTFDLICKTSMGINVETQKNRGDQGILFERAFEIMSYRMFRVWNHLDFVWYYSPNKKIFDGIYSKLYDLLHPLISKKFIEFKKELSGKHLDAEIEEESLYEKRLPFLDSMLLDPSITEKKVQDEAVAFALAGSETTASSICFLFSLLGLFPEVQQKVYEEMIDILGPDRNVEAFDLPKMKYTERVIKENLRLFPIAALVARRIEEDINLGDVILPAGSSVAFNLLYIHRNPKYWTEPLKFDPDRFLPEEIAKRHPCTFIPFLYGPRNCLGWKYAFLNMKIIIATVVREFKIFTEYKSIEEMEVVFHFTIQLKNGPKVWLERRR